MTIDNYLAQLHTGQWFTFSDPSNKSFDTLELTDYGEEQGYGLPTEEDFKAWQKEQEQKAEEQEIIQKRLSEYGSPEEQLENIIENGLEAERERVQQIKEKYPK